MLVGALVPRSSEDVYLMSAGRWLKKTLAADTRLRTNSKEVTFYSGRDLSARSISTELSPPECAPGDVVALQIAANQREAIVRAYTRADFEILHEVVNVDNDRLVVVMVFSPTRAP
jgi:hypothetical protein